MRPFERLALIFGAFNLSFGLLAMFSPFVSHKTYRRRRWFLPPPNHGLINQEPGLLLGALGAVNPQHALMHTGLGLAGLASAKFGRFSRPYLWLQGGLFTALALAGWVKVGYKPGIHDVFGFAIDWRDNFFHTLLATAAFAAATRPYKTQKVFEAAKEHFVEGLSGQTS